MGESSIGAQLCGGTLFSFSPVDDSHIVAMVDDSQKMHCKICTISIEVQGLSIAKIWSQIFSSLFERAQLLALFSPGGG